MKVPTLAILGLCLLLSSGARAERFLLQRGSTLYLADRSGQELQKFLELGASSTVLWAASPDGRRVVWARSLSKELEGSLASRPLTVSLADTLGRRQKRLLGTDTLTDRLGRPITQIGAVVAGGPTSTLADWVPVSLSWSADSRTLYLGCHRIGVPTEVMTVVLDAQTGTAVVDAEGRWKCLAPVSQLDARSTYLAAISPSLGATPLQLCNLATGTSWLPVPALGGTPAYGNALWPALAPDGKSIAFAAAPRGLWLAEGPGFQVRRLVSSEVARPRFGDDGKTVLFLAPRPATSDRVAYDLYELPLGGTSPKLVLSQVDWFDLILD